ncbi:MAG: ATP-binding protein [Bacteroidales bacterium]
MAIEKNYIDSHLYNHLINNARAMLSVINRDYCYEKVNNTFCRLHNSTHDDIIGKSLIEIWGEEAFRSKIKDNIDLCLKGNIVRYEANFDVPLSGNRFFEVVFSPLTDEKGQITHLLAETIDITDLKLSQRAVSEMEEEFKRLETSLPIGLLRCQSDGTIIHYNKAFSDILENDWDENFEGLNLKDFYKEKPLFNIQTFQSDDEKIRTFRRVPLISCKGNEIKCRVSRYVVSDKKTKLPLYIDFAFEDSSREIMLENRLIQARKLETIGALAGGIAHDFNNILASVFGYSELLLDEVKDNRTASEMTARIIKAVSKARDLTNQILTFSRQVEQEKVPVNLCDVLEEAVCFAESFKKPDISIERHYKAKEVKISADPTQLFRVFMNILTNALQAMETKGGTLRVTSEVIDASRVKTESGKSIVADNYAIVNIEDTGTGMEESVMSRIFEPYFTTREVGKGTGLGLSVAYGIISELEGEITVKSEKNKGSVFSIYIPLLENDTINEHRLSDIKKRILYITGDYCYESRILSTALGNCGYIVDLKSDIEGLTKLAGENVSKPDIVIFTSQDSTTIDSEFFYKFLQEKKINVPVIFITDSNQDLSKEKLINSGIVRNVLFKPVSLREILSAIQISLNV